MIQLSGKNLVIFWKLLARGIRAFSGKAYVVHDAIFVHESAENVKSAALIKSISCIKFENQDQFVSSFEKLLEIEIVLSSGCLTTGNRLMSWSYFLLSRNEIAMVLPSLIAETNIR